jgi:hypothetical protein
MDPAGRASDNAGRFGMTAASWVMLGSAAASAACCLSPRARATPRAQANAIGMLAVMVLAAAVPSPFVYQGGALILLTLGGAVGLGLVNAGSFHLHAEYARAIEAHRAAGTVLTAAALLVHQHTGGGVHQHTAQAASAHPASLVVLAAATVAYVAWTLVAIIRSHASMIQLLRWEHVTMATCVAAMVLS